ncbi:MAG TPA: YicC/YloC family endoribonuclease [Longimicrobiales bacterium]
MIRSMTGYGTAERETPAGRLRVEIKTVNHDTFRASFRLPSALEMAEVQIREWLRAYVQRGHVSFSLRLEPVEVAAGTTLRLDEARVREYLGLLGALKERFGLPGEVDVAMLSRYSDIIQRHEEDEDARQVALDDVRAVTEEAARAVVALREEEGRRLEADLRERLEAIEAALAVVAERAPARLIEERNRLRAAVVELADGVGVDEERLAREIAFLAEKWDISEELVRLRSHIALFRDTLALDATEPVGKRLRFVSQEMHREANTIGSKANDVTIQHQVIAIKNEIDRLREQIENVE